MKALPRIALNLIPALIVLGVCLSQISWNWLGLLVFPATYLFGILTEWFVHKYLLHRKFFATMNLYRWHMIHHGLYRTKFWMSNLNEIENVIIPLSGVAYLFLLIIPIMMLLASLIGLSWWLGIAFVVFYLFYEVSHVTHHWKSEKLWLVSFRSHHQSHHQKWSNFNFGVTSTYPDRWLGTYRD